VVTITNAGNESLPSAEVNASLPGGAPPSPWLSQDIGPVGLAGSVSYCNGQFSISGSGADLWGTADACQFVYVYVPVSTNCDVRARVYSVQNTSSNAKGALMIRESLNSNAREVFADGEPSAGIEFIWRSATGGSCSSATASGTPPNWVRLTRTNNTFTAYYSADGNSWTVLGTPTNISMAASVYVGLAACAHNNAALTTAVIDNFSASFLPTNIAPTLAPIANQTVNVGQTVAITASASDSNYPPRTLIFSQILGPASATLLQLNNTNAAFNWRPQVTDASTVNPVTLKVTDSIAPGLSATRSFNITVNPLTQPTMQSVGWNNGQLTLSVSNSLLGPDYSVQASSNLLNWTTLFITNSPPQTAFQWTDTNSTAVPAQFYRIKVGPPLP